MKDIIIPSEWLMHEFDRLKAIDHRTLSVFKANELLGRIEMIKDIMLKDIEYSKTKNNVI
jgi:hypothetical protein